MTEATLGLKVESGQVRSASGDLDRLTAAGKRAENAAVKLTSASRQQGTSVVNAGLNAAQAAANLEQLHLSSEKAGVGARFLTGLVKGMVLALAGGALLGAIKSSVSALAELGDRMADTRLSGDVLQGLRIGAAGARVSQDELNKSIDFFTEVSKKAAVDAKEFYRALAQISPAMAEAFKGQAGKEGGQDERLRILADAMKAATTETQRFQLAQKALGTDNERVIQMFVRGRMALDEYIETARRYGILADETFIKKAQEAERTLGVLATVLSDKLRMAVVDLLPDLQRMAPYLDILATKVGDFLSSYAALGDRPTGTLARQLEEDRQEIEKLAGLLGQASWLDNFSGKTDEVKGRLEALKKEMVDIQAILERRAVEPKPPPPPPSGGSGYAPRSSLKDNAVDSATFAIRRQIAALEADALAVGQTAGAHARLRVEAQLLEAGMKAGLSPETVRATKNFQDLGARAQGAADALARARINSDIKFDRDTMFLSDVDVQIAQTLRDLYGNDVPAALASSEAAAMRFNAELRQASDIGKDAFKGFAQDIMAGKNATEALHSALNKVAQKLMDMAIDNLWASAFGGAKGGGGLVSSLFSGLFGGGGVLPGGAPMGQGGIGARAAGGPVSGGSPYLIGERGPEIFVPNRSGFVVPNHAMGGGNVTNNFIVENRTDGTVEQRKQRNSSGGVDHRVIIREAVKDDWGNGQFDDVNRGRFGNRPAKVR